MKLRDIIMKKSMLEVIREQLEKQPELKNTCAVSWMNDDIRNY